MYDVLLENGVAQAASKQEKATGRGLGEVTSDSESQRLFLKFSVYRKPNDLTPSWARQPWIEGVIKD